MGGASGAPAGPPRNMSGAPDCTDRAVTGVLSMSQISKIYENMSIFQDEDDGGIIFLYSVWLFYNVGSFEPFLTRKNVNFDGRFQKLN